jgi:hypothetical protein
VRQLRREEVGGRPLKLATIVERLQDAEDMLERHGHTASGRAIVDSRLMHLRQDVDRAALLLGRRATAVRQPAGRPRGTRAHPLRGVAQVGASGGPTVKGDTKTSQQLLHEIAYHARQLQVTTSADRIQRAHKAIAVRERQLVEALRREGAVAARLCGECGAPPGTTPRCSRCAWARRVAATVPRG